MDTDTDTVKPLQNGSWFKWKHAFIEKHHAWKTHSDNHCSVTQVAENCFLWDKQESSL
jgi:hypothetical protein